MIISTKKCLVGHGWSFEFMGVSKKGQLSMFAVGFIAYIAIVTSCNWNIYRVILTEMT